MTAPPGGPPPRPEVVQAIYSALIDTDPAKLASLTSITPAERKQGEDLFLATMLATEDHRDRQADAWEVLTARPWPPDATWEQVFDGLTPERAARLGELHDALPEGARIECARRYGQPPGA